MDNNSDILAPGGINRIVDHKNYVPHLYNDHFQNYKRHNIPKAQLIIADIPYNVGKDAYGSNPTNL